MDNDFTLLRLGQIYLIRAEAAARVGGGWDGAAALTDTNIIRARLMLMLILLLSLQKLSF